MGEVTTLPVDVTVVRERLAADGGPPRDHVFFGRMLSGGVQDKAHEAYGALVGGRPAVALDAAREAARYAAEVLGHLEQAVVQLEATVDPEARPERLALERR